MVRIQVTKQDGTTNVVTQREFMKRRLFEDRTIRKIEVYDEMTYAYSVLKPKKKKPYIPEKYLGGY